MTRVTKNTARPFKRTGLHRVDCPDCDGYAYSTVANLETVGLPHCACGAQLQPERLELALMLGVDAPIVFEYRRRVDRKERAQMPAARRPCQLMEDLASMDARAAAEITSEQRADARARRLAAIVPTPEPLPF